MTLRMPGVGYVGPPDSNWSDGEIRPPFGMIVHIAEGSYQGTISWQRNPSADVSSYFVVSKGGEIAQMLDLDLMAWTQGSGNPAWVGVENEGFSTEGFTDAQVNANARIFAWLRSVWPSIPAQVTNSTSAGGLGWHGMGGAAWGNHPGCPGAVNVALLPTILARAGGGVNPGPGPIPGDDDMPLLHKVLPYTENGQPGKFSGAIIILSGTTWYHLTTPELVAASKRLWGFTTEKPLSIADLPAAGAQVPFAAAIISTPAPDAAAVATALVALPAFKALLVEAARAGANLAEDS